jgi:hypothetical protein
MRERALGGRVCPCRPGVESSSNRRLSGHPKPASLTMSAPVKHFFSAVLRALWEEPHFALAENISIAIATKARL